MNDFIVLDLETTGLNPKYHEILQIGIIDSDGRTLLSTYVKPVRTDRWDEAEKIHHITPDMVQDAPTLDVCRVFLDDIFKNVNKIVGYNINFDLQFLESAGFDFSRFEVIDVMQAFAPIYGEWNDYFQNYKWQKLETCAKYYNFIYAAHDALEDVRATLHCYYNIFEYAGYVSVATELTDNDEFEVLENCDFVCSTRVDDADYDVYVSNVRGVPDYYCIKTHEYFYEQEEVF